MNPFKRTEPHKCQKCGQCCKNRGDMAFDFDDDEPEYEPDDCTALDADGKTCRMYDNRRSFCVEYPWDEWCERELKEKGLWEQFLLPERRPK